MSCKVSLFMKIYGFSNIFHLNRKILTCFKRKQEKIGEENSWILRFGIRENMSRTCYYFAVAAKSCIGTPRVSTTDSTLRRKSGTLVFPEAIPF